MIGIAQRLSRDQRGTASVELTVVIVVLLFLSLGILDFGRIVFDWNAAHKAAEVGAQTAVVRDPVAVPLKNHYQCNVPADRSIVGQLCLDGQGNMRSECQFDVVLCDSTGCTAGGTTYSYSSGDGIVSSTLFDSIIAEMRNAFPRLEAENVEISYRATALGFVGMPRPVAEVTVAVDGVEFEFLGLAPFAAFAGTTLEIPTQRVTLTAEDLSDNTCEDQGLASADDDGQLICQAGGGNGNANGNGIGNGNGNDDDRVATD